jgi:hypothetical protein
MDNEKNNPIEKLATTMYIKNRRNSNKFKGFGSCQTLCLIESLSLSTALMPYTKRYAQAYKLI